MTLSEMRQILAAHDIRLTKSLGQNFLHDGNQLRRIVAAAGLKASDRVLEIGPGLGPLTELLLAEAGEVFAIEKDERLFKLLQERFAGRSHLRLLRADALDCLRADHAGWQGWKVVSNLPYSVASPILVELALSGNPPARLVATLQLEVARRLTAEAGSGDYGVLTLLVQLRYEPRGLFRIPAGCFHPPPDVDSGCIVLDLRSRELLPRVQRDIFVELVKRAFSQRRKIMFKLLKPRWATEELDAAFAAAELAASTRAEDVTLQQFVRLTRALSPQLRHDE